MGKLSDTTAEIGPSDRHKARITTVGKKITMIAYNVISKGRPFSDFSDWVSVLCSAQVDLGNINHSVNFFDRYMHALTVCLKKNVKEFLNRALPCTKQLPNLCWKPDKFSKNGVSYQAIIVRHLCLKNGHLFCETYIGHTPVMQGSSMPALTDLM